MMDTRTTAGSYRNITLVVAILGLLAFALADIEISHHDPYAALQNILQGLIQPDLSDTEYLLSALANTISFALVGLSLAAVTGLILSHYHRWPLVAHFCAFIRSIHELFWALIFLQMFGLSAITGILAIAIPYSGTFGRVFNDILARSTVEPQLIVAQSTSKLSAWLYGPLAQCWPVLLRYTRYRLECALRSATVLGFIGLPTLGYYLETAFSQGDYQQAGGLLLLSFALIATIKWWLRTWLIPGYLIAAMIYLPWKTPLEWQYLWRFISQDIVPQPLRSADFQLEQLTSWLFEIVSQQILPGIWATLLLSVAALLLTALLALSLWPFASRLLVGHGQVGGHGLLIILRTTPEFVITFILMLLLGPSMLPAIIALALHNGGIIAYLLARNSEQIKLRVDQACGLDLWSYQLQPQLYPSFIAWLFYRFEVILRESAILGMLGVTTLGFYIDSAFEALHFDIALLLILATAIINITVNYCSLRLRQSLKVDNLVLL